MYIVTLLVALMIGLPVAAGLFWLAWSALTD